MVVPPSPGDQSGSGWNGKVEARGRFFFAGAEKVLLKGVTYGPFAPTNSGQQFPNPATVELDLALMNELGANTLRTFTVPPRWLLDLAFPDFVAFTVSLPREHVFRRYLYRLHTLAADRPLVLTEFGMDSHRDGPRTQATALSWQVRTALTAGVAGTFVFSFTDEWFTGGHHISNWAFLLGDSDRQRKPAVDPGQRSY